MADSKPLIPPPVYAPQGAPQQAYPPPGGAAPPMPPQYYAGPTQGYTTTTIVSGPVIAFGRDPVVHTCQYCRFSGPTVVEYEAAAGTWIMVGGLAIFGFWLCCCVPLLIDGCKDAVHICPQCRAAVGRKSVL